VTIAPAILAAGKGILKFVQRVPFLGSPFSFPFAVAWRGLVEVLILWFFSTLPIFFSILPKIDSDRSLSEELSAELSINLILVYTSAFLAPVFYLLFARVIWPRSHKIFGGAGWVLIGTLCIMFLSCWLYQNDRISNPNSWRTVSTVMYFASIYFWWLAILDDRNSVEFEVIERQAEDAFAKAAAARQQGTHQ